MSDLIGFFDSGLGGISVLHEARRVMPNENYLFFGDNKNTPYGPRSLKEIRALSEAGIGRLLDRGVKAVVIACNTVTSAYGEIVRAEHPELPIIGMEPALKPAHFARHGGKVIVLATDATLRLEKFKRLMARFGTSAVITDPHEIGNVAALDGLAYQMDSAADNGYINVFFVAPSCVPTLTDMSIAG